MLGHSTQILPTRAQRAHAAAGHRSLVCSLVAPRKFTFSRAFQNGESQPRPTTTTKDRNAVPPTDAGGATAAAGAAMQAASGMQPAGPNRGEADQQQPPNAPVAVQSSSSTSLVPASGSNLQQASTALQPSPSRSQPAATNTDEGLRLEDAFAEFESRLEADLATVGVTLLGILGVIIFWRGVWSLLDYIFGDNPLGDLVCILVGLGIIIYIRLAGLRVGSFWPSS